MILVNANNAKNIGAKRYVNISPIMILLNFRTRPHRISCRYLLKTLMSWLLRRILISKRSVDVVGKVVKIFASGI